MVDLILLGISGISDKLANMNLHRMYVLISTLAENIKNAGLSR